MAGSDVAAAIALLEENLWDMWAVYGRGEGCVLIDTPELLRFETPVPHAPYNTVARFRGDDRLSARVDDALAPYVKRAVPVMWELHPTSPPGLEALLTARGFEVSEVGVGMVVDLARVPPVDAFPANVRVDQVGVDRRGDCVELVSWRYSLPPEAQGTVLSIMESNHLGSPDSATKAWVARIDGRPVAMVEVHYAAGVAGLYGVMTRPEARRIGLARNLAALALGQARADGYEMGVLHASPMAESLYTALGFRKVVDFPLLACPGGGR